MMLDKIKSFYSSKNICIENIYISMCRALRRPEKNIYAYSWNFGYCPTGDSFAKKITISRDGQIINTQQQCALSEFCGIKPIWHSNCDMKNFVDNVVKKELKKSRPVALAIDIFSCYWHIFFNQFHFVHYCLITGMDDEGLICVDDTLASGDGFLRLNMRSKRVKISFEVLEKYSFGYVTYETNLRMADYSSEKMIYLAALKTLTGFNGVSDFDNMRKLISDIDENFDIETELEKVSDIRAMALPRTFGSLFWSRYNYYSFLEDKKVDCKLNMEFILSEMHKSVILWEEIFNYILKCAITRKNMSIKKVLHDNLSKIISIEENIAKYIVNEYEMKFYE